MSDVETSRGGRLYVPRSRGAVSGLFLVLLGAWGALIPFIGPYFNFGFTPDTTWTWTSARFWYEVLPGIVTMVGGFLLLVSANRVTASFGGWIAAAAGAWLAVGSLFAPVLSLGSIGAPIGNGETRHAWASTVYFVGLGAVIVFFAALAIGRLSVVGVRDVRAARARTERAAAEAAPADEAATRDVPHGTAEGEPAGATAADSGRGSASTAGAESHYETDAEGRRWDTDAQGRRWTTDAQGRRWTTDAEGRWHAETG